MELFDVVCLVMTMSSNRRAAKYVISTKAQSPFNWNFWLRILFSLFPSHHNGLMWQWKTSLPTETSELMEQSVLDKPIINQQVKFPVFHEPKCSLLCSQNPITGLCPEPDESSPTISHHFFNPAPVPWGLCDPSPLWLTFLFKLSRILSSPFTYFIVRSS